MRKDVRQSRDTEGGIASAMSRARDHGIDITLSHDPATLERPVTAVPPMTIAVQSKWFPVSRGPVALIIEMPARSALATLVTALAIPLVLIVGLVLAIRLVDPSMSGWVVSAILVASVILIVAIWLGTCAPFAPRETLEIDSVLATLRRGSVYLGAWSRATFDDVRVADPDTRNRVQGRSMLGGVPTLVWGFYDDGISCVGGAGAGISHDAATRVLDEIDRFRAGNPPDPDSRRVLGVTRVRSLRG